MMRNVCKMCEPHELLAAVLYRAPCRRNGIGRCGLVSPRILDLV